MMDEKKPYERHRGAVSSRSCVPLGQSLISMQLFFLIPLTASSPPRPLSPLHSIPSHQPTVLYCSVWLLPVSSPIFAYSTSHTLSLVSSVVFPIFPFLSRFFSGFLLGVCMGFQLCLSHSAMRSLFFSFEKPYHINSRPPLAPASSPPLTTPSASSPPSPPYSPQRVSKIQRPARPDRAHAHLLHLHPDPCQVTQAMVHPP